jgi:hypothetical protein
MTFTVGVLIFLTISQLCQTHFLLVEASPTRRGAGKTALDSRLDETAATSIPSSTTQKVLDPAAVQRIEKIWKNGLPKSMGPGIRRAAEKETHITLGQLSRWKVADARRKEEARAKREARPNYLQVLSKKRELTRQRREHTFSDSVESEKYHCRVRLQIKALQYCKNHTTKEDVEKKVVIEMARMQTDAKMSHDEADQFVRKIVQPYYDRRKTREAEEVRNAANALASSQLASQSSGASSSSGAKLDIHTSALTHTTSNRVQAEGTHVHHNVRDIASEHGISDIDGGVRHDCTQSNPFVWQCARHRSWKRPESR